MSIKNTTRRHTHPRVVSIGRTPTRYVEPILWSHAYLALQATAMCMHSPDRACTRPIENILIDSVSLYCASSADGRTTSWSPVINHLIDFCIDPRPPRTVVKRHRKKATLIWVVLLVAFSVCESTSRYSTAVLCSSGGDSWQCVRS